MYHSTFLVNRQMITDPAQIEASLGNYIATDGTKFSDFFYRLEWYRIGISIPMDVYSVKRPELQLRPECQLTYTEKLEKIPDNASELSFKIFIIPYKAARSNEDLTQEFISSWLNKKLKGAAEILSSELGPNNRIYYRKKPDDKLIAQIQSYTLRGKIRVLDASKLERIRRTPLGCYKELGCGLLLLE